MRLGKTPHARADVDPQKGKCQGGLRIHELFITFDVEDFVNIRSTEALCSILELLKKHHVKALFFITGHVAEKLESSNKVVDLLEDHEIGYHSSSHSVRPNIIEYTDLESYQDAYEISLRRETSHINPSSGTIDGEGGIKTLRDVFSKKKIEAYRAPGFSWSPPHLEALKTLGFKYDFSAKFSKLPVCYKEITFYPFPILIDWKDSVNYYKDLLAFTLSRQITVVDFHPDRFVNQSYWDSFFPDKAPQIRLGQTKRLLTKLESLLNTIRVMQKVKLLEAVSKPTASGVPLDTANVDTEKVQEQIEAWSITRCSYRPRFLRSHLLKFFGQPQIKLVRSK